jgi:RNA polymerase sigma-70 factor (ECF subfamily)
MLPYVLHLNAQPLKTGADPIEAAERRRLLDGFLRSVERRALRMAEFQTGHREDALELVQDSMLGFVHHYAAKPAAEWTPLFYRVLDSRLLDFHRRRKVRSRWLGWWPAHPAHADDDATEAVAEVADDAEPGPLHRLADGEMSAALDAALRALPLRQRQCFLLRIWEGLDVAATATAMQCGEGSVKTHLSRALAALRQRLDAHHD